MKIFSINWSFKFRRDKAKIQQQAGLSSCRKRERGKLVEEQFLRRGLRAHRLVIAVCERAEPCALEKPSRAGGV